MEYEVKLREASKELTARDKIRYKNFSAAIALDTLVADDKESFSFAPVGYAVFDVHNEHAENSDYPLYIIEDSSGNLYKTGSLSFFGRFKDIFDTMVEESEGEQFTVSVIKRPSARYKGKYILLAQLD